MMRVQNQSLTVEVTDPVKMVKKQEQIIKELRQELLMHDALADRAGVLYDPYTPEQQVPLQPACAQGQGALHVCTSARAC